MKKILLVNDHIHFGGGGDAVFRFEKAVLLKSGYEVYTLSFGDINIENEHDIVIKASYSIVKSKIHKFIISSKLEKAVTKSVENIKPDLIHLHLISKFPLAIYNSPFLKNIPIIQTLHGPNLFCATSWGGLKNSGSCELGIGIKCFTRGCINLPTSLLYIQLKQRYWQSLSENIDLFHCPSLNILNSAKRLGLKNSKYIPLGIDEEYLQEPFKIKHERPTLLYVGAIVEQKGVQFLLPALAKIKKVVPNVLLKIAGKGNLLEKLKIDSRILELTENVQFLGFVDHKKIRDFYLSGDVFLMPSIWQEQFGLVGPEALACQIPCVGSNVGGISEWLKHNDNGFLVPPQEIDELASATIRLLKDDQLREEMGKRGRAFILSEYSSNKYSSAILKMIKQLL